MSSCSSTSCNGHADGGKSKASSSKPLEEQVGDYLIWVLPNLFQQYILEAVRKTILKNIRSTLSKFQALTIVYILIYQARYAFIKFVN